MSSAPDPPLAISRPSSAHSTSYTEVSALALPPPTHVQFGFEEETTKCMPSRSAFVYIVDRALTPLQLLFRFRSDPLEERFLKSVVLVVMMFLNVALLVYASYRLIEFFLTFESITGQNWNFFASAIIEFIACGFFGLNIVAFIFHQRFRLMVNICILIGSVTVCSIFAFTGFGYDNKSTLLFVMLSPYFGAMIGTRLFPALYIITIGVYAGFTSYDAVVLPEIHNLRAAFIKDGVAVMLIFSIVYITFYSVKTEHLETIEMLSAVAKSILTLEFENSDEITTLEEMKPQECSSVLLQFKGIIQIIKLYSTYLPDNLKCESMANLMDEKLTSTETLSERTKKSSKTKDPTDLLSRNKNSSSSSDHDQHHHSFSSDGSSSSSHHEDPVPTSISTNSSGDQLPVTPRPGTRKRRNSLFGQRKRSGLTRLRLAQAMIRRASQSELLAFQESRLSGLLVLIDKDLSSDHHLQSMKILQNRIVTILLSVLAQTGGKVIRIDGVEILVVFNTEKRIVEHEKRACFTALQLLSNYRTKYSSSRHKKVVPFRMVVASGKGAFGTGGCDQKKEYQIFGEMKEKLTWMASRFCTPVHYRWDTAPSFGVPTESRPMLTIEEECWNKVHFDFVTSIVDYHPRWNERFYTLTKLKKVNSFNSSSSTEWMYMIRDELVEDNHYELLSSDNVLESTENDRIEAVMMALEDIVKKGWRCFIDREFGVAHERVEEALTLVNDLGEGQVDRSNLTMAPALAFLIARLLEQEDEQSKQRLLEQEHRFSGFS